MAFELLSVLSFKLAKCLGIFLLSLEKVVVPLLVEIVVLLDVCLLAFFSLLCLVKEKLVSFALIILEFELSNPVLGHLSLDVLALDLAGVPVFLEDLAVWVVSGVGVTYMKSWMLSSLGS
jgi:hypothetical protein